MDMTKLVAIALCGTMLALILKEQKPHLGIALSALTAVTVLIFSMPQLMEIAALAKTVYRAAGGKDAYMNALFKITAIAFLARIGSDLCKDAGMTAVASAVGFAGRIMCLVLCLPQITELFQTLLSVLPG